MSAVIFTHVYIHRSFNGTKRKEQKEQINILKSCLLKQASIAHFENQYLKVFQLIVVKKTLEVKKGLKLEHLRLEYRFFLTARTP